MNLDQIFETMPGQRGSSFDEYMTLVKQRLTGKITHAEVLGAVQANTRELAMKLMDMWGRGDLLPSQRMSFHEWLSVDKERHWRETFRATESLATFDIFGERPAGFKEFVDLRIWTPGLGQRKAIADAGASDGIYQEASRKWADQNQRFEWSWT